MTWETISMELRRQDFSSILLVSGAEVIIDTAKAFAKDVFIDQERKLGSISMKM